MDSEGMLEDLVGYPVSSTMRTSGKPSRPKTMNSEGVLQDEEIYPVSSTLKISGKVSMS